MSSNENRSSFTGKLGFVLAAAGSAVGLGNIWRFPYLAAQYGGGIFLLVYIVLAVTFGFALMTAEIAIGRKTGLSAIGAFKKLDKRFGFVGIIAAVVPIIILPYYSVIGGWVAKYLVAFCSGEAITAATAPVPQSAIDAAIAAGKDAPTAAQLFFNGFVSDVWSPLFWFAVFLGITALVVLLGVEKGIEKVSKVMMPVLIVLTIFIAGYAMCMPGAMEGVKYYLLPDFSSFSVKTVLAAMGQLFYSMSLAMGIMITYGSYMKKDVSIESAVGHIEIFDTGIAFLAGLMIVPAAFAFNGGNVNSGPGLMFATLPAVFAKMPFGEFIGIAFFLLVLLAALTSSISLMETIVSIFCDKFKMRRIPACIVVIVISVVLGALSSLGNGSLGHIKLLDMDFLTFFDFISNSVIMPIVALLTCIVVGFIIKPKTICEEVELTGHFKRRALFEVIIKYVAPICIVLILVTSVLGAFKIFEI